MSRSFDDDAQPAESITARFDRLVDGELPADEYRTLVASLDDEPGGWRRCALAFLESQALSGEISGLRRGMTLGDDDGPSQATAPTGSATAHVIHKPGFFRLTTILAMAASFLVAFGLGIAMPRWFPGGAHRAVVENPSSGPVREVATGPSRPDQPRHESFRPVANVQFMVDGPGGDSTRVGDLPIYEPSGPLDQWLADERPALSPEVLQTLQESGHQIERQIEYVTVQLDDGRQVIVPIERYQIQPPSKLPY